MPEYLTPGVYIEELPTANQPIEGVSTSTVGFLGVAERGPAVPTLVTSFTDYRAFFGDYYKDANGADYYLGYAVEGFFLNGGQRCFVQRVYHADPANPDNSDKSAAGTLGPMQVTAVGPGTWGNNVMVEVAAAGSGDQTRFKLNIYYPADANPPLPPKEVFDGLDATPQSSGFYETVVNGSSYYVTLKQTQGGLPGAGSTTLSNGTQSADLTLADFQGTSADPGSASGLAAFEGIDEISILCCPDEFRAPGGFADSLATQCENLKSRFAILQAQQSAGPPSNHFPSRPSQYAAYYYPWLQITQPLTGQSMLIPPGGHVAGIYARSDDARGVHKDPANELIRGIDAVQLQITKDQQAVLNPRGVNVLRYFKGSGNLVWGGRTTSTDPSWKYINVRRLFIFVEESIKRAMQWVVFEPNDEPLWAGLRRSVGDFLRRLWMDGMLQGAKKEEAYFVKCDRTTMTQADLDNGRLIMVIGIAPVKPAEFVIFRIGQWDGGTQVDEG
jgi:phage tail sheath protein FI